MLGILKNILTDGIFSFGIMMGLFLIAVIVGLLSLQDCSLVFFFSFLSNIGLSVRNRIFGGRDSLEKDVVIRSLHKDVLDLQARIRRLTGEKDVPWPMQDKIIQQRAASSGR